MFDLLNKFNGIGGGGGGADPIVDDKLSVDDWAQINVCKRCASSGAGKSHIVDGGNGSSLFKILNNNNNIFFFNYY